MNHWLDERTAEYNRQRTIEEIKQIRLEKLALKSCLYRPGVFERTMFNFANWMISTGRQLRKRYEIPVPNGNQRPTRGLAR